MCQDLQLSGAVAVTTPSKLAIADARKGIEMFSTLGVPTLALVENMSYFEVRKEAGVCVKGLHQSCVTSDKPCFSV